MYWRCSFRRYTLVWPPIGPPGTVLAEKTKQTDHLVRVIQNFINSRLQNWLGVDQLALLLSFRGTS